MELTMLGTGNALVTRCYNTCFIISDENRHFLVDGGGGNGILRQLRVTGFKWMDIGDIFVTHKHVDHFLGIIWLVRAICSGLYRGGFKGEVRIYGNSEVVCLIKNLAGQLLRSQEAEFIGKGLKLVEVKDGESLDIIGHKTSFFDIGSPDAMQYGFSMDLGEGKKLTCCGDESYNEKAKPYAENAEWLLHEAFCLYEERDIFQPYEKSHSTVKDACETAARLGVKNLLLYHTEDMNIKERKALYTNEGKQYFKGNLFIPDDLEKISL